MGSFMLAFFLQGKTTRALHAYDPEEGGLAVGLHGPAYLANPQQIGLEHTKRPIRTQSFYFN